MKLHISIAGNFTENMDDGDLVDLKEDLEDTLRMDYGGGNITVEIQRS